MIACPSGIRPVEYDPIYLKGYEEGFKQAKEEIAEKLSKMKALSDCTGTATTDGEF